MTESPARGEVCAPLKLIIFHYHFRPGGVRRVIESAAPFLLREMPRIDGVILAGGEARDSEWNEAVEKSLAPAAVEFFIEPTFRYVSEQRHLATLTARIRAALTRLLKGDGETLVWAHNLSIARNLPLARELARACAARDIRMIAHHHDWWFDNRWLRWPEMKRTGFRTLKQTAETLFPKTPHARFATINRADAGLLRKHLGTQAGWLPNPTAPAPPPTRARLRSAKIWMREKLREDAPVWLMPCRLLRRKNVAEALLLTRWLRPEAVLVTTGGASSSDELPYAQRLAAAAQKHDWRLRIGLLDREDSAPPLPELLAASECLLLTSIQEGFGLASLEAAAAGRPLIARRLPNIAPDLHRFGFRFPHIYREVLIAPDAFDWDAEQRRQSAIFAAWKQTLPSRTRAWAESPLLLRTPARVPVPFNRLTLTAQIEILAVPATESWDRCARWNPLLRAWKPRAAAGALECTRWPETADRWLGGSAYARRFAKIAGAKTHTPSPQKNASAAQEDFIRLKLQTAHLFPLLFARTS